MNNSTEKLLEVLTLEGSLSDFPDEILCHILSFMNTKEAVATSILSKRWQFLWYYFDTLDIEVRPGSKLKFEKYVNRALQLHRGVIIKRMRLACYKCRNDDYVKWIETAMSKKVQTLHLCFRNGSHNWPRCLFNSQTLVELILEYVDITNTNIPAAPFFPNLKKLRLYQPYFTYDSLNRFISGCSILEYFSLDSYNDERHYWYRGACYISSATLKKIWYSNPYSTSLRIVLNTPVLEVLKFQKTRISELVIQSSMPSLRKAEIYSNSLWKCLNVLSNVSSLCVRVHEDPVYLRSMYEPNLHAHFDNLTRLEILSHRRFHLDLLRIFIVKSKNLKAITLEKQSKEQPSLDQSEVQTGGVIWEKPQHVPECFLSSLESVSIFGYPKEDEEMDSMIKYIMRNAKVLKLLKLRFFKEGYAFRFHILEKISMFGKACKNCEISVD